MSIEVELPLDALRRPEVAEALSNLIAALGGQAPSRKAKAPASARPRPRKSGQRRKMTWPEFRASLSPQTQQFLALLIERKRLTIANAQSELGLAGKGLGGLTGAMQRKANAQGIELPFSSGKSRAGTRMWVLKPSVLKKLEA